MEYGNYLNGVWHVGVISVRHGFLCVTGFYEHHAIKQLEAYLDTLTTQPGLVFVKAYSEE